ncbi:hypothetical protein CHS0354_008162 [Potamilus streckersoni]|uniref:Uncharacterized protein n=2 Tax=Potamilus streckersoni TaxID=2493646 RepID=A0AAE0VWE9_9BIVA|nr:hypothetical protein CHS0354_008162 [Potamilus streckersoni]
MSKVDPAFSSPPQPEAVLTNQPMHYAPPGYYPNAPYTQHPGFPQMQMMQPIQQSSNTTVVINQQPQRRAGPRDWSTGLFGCLEDVSSCMGVYCCIPCYACYLAVELGESCCLPICFPPCECAPACGTPTPWLVALRVKVREANKIQGSIMGDCMAVCCCPACVMCQLKRENDFIRQHPNDL